MMRMLRVGHIKACCLCLSSLVLSTTISLFAANDPSVADAMKRKDTVAVHSLVDHRANVNEPQPDGATALHWAAYWDDVDSAGVLIRAGADPNAANDYSVNPLMLACNNGSEAMVKVLLAAGANPKAAMPSGETVLMRCARTGSVEPVNLLIAAGADVNAKEKEKGQTALMWAVAQRHAAVAR